MPKDGGGKGKGKGKRRGGGGTDGGGGGGKGFKNFDKKPPVWQCKHCDDKIWSGGAFCTGCGGSKAACKRPPRSDPNLDKFLEESRKIRKEMEDLRKDLQKKVTDKAPNHRAGGGGGKGNGKSYLAAASVHPPSVAVVEPPTPSQQQPPPPLQPKAISNHDIWVQLDGASVTLATLHEMLDYNKLHFAEGHVRVTEIRDAIARGHQLRSDNIELAALVQQTERNILNKQRAIDKAKGKIDELKAKRDELDASILAKEAKLNMEIDLLDTFKVRLRDA